MDEDRLNMIVQAMGRAVMELSMMDSCISAHLIADKLEQYRRETGNVIGKGVNRDAAEIVRCGSRAFK